MKKNIRENRAVIRFAFNFANIVEKKNWVSRYDTDTDSFSISVKRLPKDARLKYFGNEFAFYLTSAGQVKGVFIEYFKKNFMKHNKGIDEIKGLLSKMEVSEKEEDGGALLEIKTSAYKMNIIKSFESALEDSLARGIQLEPVC